MRRAKIFWRGREGGTLPVPDSFRPPISQAQLDAIPAMLIARSRSWLLEIRPGDLRLELRGSGLEEEVVVVANDRLGPGDIGLLVGFEAAPGCEFLKADESMIMLADEILETGGGRS